MMTYIGIAGLVVAIGLGAAGLGIAVKNSSTESTTTSSKVISPYALGKLTNFALTNELKKVFWADTGSYKYKTDIEANSQTVVVPTALYAANEALQTNWDKATSGMGASALAKHVAGLSNKITINVASTGVDLVNRTKTFSLVITQSWIDKGEVQYVLTAPTGFTAGTGNAGSAGLFGGKIAGSASLTGWLFAKKDGGAAAASGSDATLAIKIDAKTGEVIMLNGEKIAKDTLTTAITESKRNTTL